MSCATRSTGSPLKLGHKHGFWVMFSLALFVACSSGSDNGGGSTNNTPNNPPAGGASQLAYVINFAGNNVQPFTSDGSGKLTPVGGPVTVGSHPHNVNVDKAGRFVHIANHDSNFVSGYRVNADGSLTPINNAPGSPVTNLANNDPTDNNPHWSVFDTTGAFLYVINGVPPVPSTLKSYQVNADGTLNQSGRRVSSFNVPTGITSRSAPTTSFSMWVVRTAASCTLLAVMPMARPRAGSPPL